MEIKENIPLKDLNTFGVEAVARFFTEINFKAEISEALKFAKTRDLPIFVLGGGSNVLISDSGFDGLVIHNKIKGLRLKDGNKLVVGGGEEWDRVVITAVKKGLAGIECLSGIPGSAGGAVVQNAGAYGQAVADVIDTVEAVSLETGKLEKFGRRECGFEYRTSFFKKNPGKYCITSFIINLSTGNYGLTSYADVKKYFEVRNVEPTLNNIRLAVLEIRQGKGMLIMPGLDFYKSVGSFFKNPTVDGTTFARLKPLLAPPDGRTWYWQQATGEVKLSAARIVVEAGFEKGLKEGRVGISPKQPLAIINLGKASASEIKSFAQKIKRAVWEKFGINLEEEALYVGKFD